MAQFSRLTIRVCLAPFALLTLTACPAESGSTNEGAALLALLAASGANTSATTTQSCSRLSASTPTGTAVADRATSAPGHTGSGYSDVACATNGIRGAGNVNGSLDVFSLTATGNAASVVLEWSDRRVTNGTGNEFVVFENVLYLNGDSTRRFMEPIIVEVSRDNSTYCGWTPDYTNSPETTYSQNPTYWSRFAGITPGYYNQDSNPLDASQIFVQSTAGGDGFDLGDANFGSGCTTTERDAIRSNGFVYVRLSAATSRTNADTGAVFVSDGGGFGGGPDIDGVIARYLTSR